MARELVYEAVVSSNAGTLFATFVNFLDYETTFITLVTAAMNEWPRWFIEPMTTLPQTTPEYRLALARRRIGEIKDLLAEVAWVAESATEGELVRCNIHHVAKIRREVADVERSLANN
jgi:hypothetical protein